MYRICLPEEKERPLVFYLAMEEYLAANLPLITKGEEAFFLWQVAPTVIFGRNQDMEAEVNVPYCKENGIAMYRRRSGGGCVYADRGNIMASYISPSTDVSSTFSRYLRLMAGALSSLGLEALPSDRNDILSGGRKISGNAFFRMQDASIVHGTLLFDSDLSVMEKALTPSPVKVLPKGVASVRQRVGMIKEEFAHRGITMHADGFKEAIYSALCEGSITLTESQIAEIEEIEKGYLDPLFIYGKNIKTDNMEEKLTCLYDKHLSLGAKMSPFAGFMMPIQYSSITEEHNAVRHAAGMFDVSHMGEIFISGPDAEAYVNHIFTNEIRGFEPGKVLYGMMLYPEGGVVDDLLVYREFEPEHFLLVVNAANIDKDYEWMLAQKGGFDVKIDNQSESWGQIALQGPEAEKFIVSILGLEKAAGLSFYTYYEDSYMGSRMIVSRTGYTGEDGFEIYASHDGIKDIWDRLLKGGVVPCGLGCRDTLRFEAGLPLYGDELSADITPVEAGLGMFCKWDKDFIGKEALLAQKAAGPAKKLVGIEVMDKAIPRAGYPVELEDGTPVGVVTTGYHSISLDKSICFALVGTSYSALDTPLWVHIRKKVFPGKVVKKRFYQTNYKK